MSGRHQPEHGADSPEGRRPYRVLVCDRFEPDERRWVTVPAAYGPHDAFSQVRYALPEVSVLRAEEAA